MIIEQNKFCFFFLTYRKERKRKKNKKKKMKSRLNDVLVLVTSTIMIMMITLKSDCEALITSRQDKFEVVRDFFDKKTTLTSTKDDDGFSNATFIEKKYDYKTG